MNNVVHGPGERWPGKQFSSLDSSGGGPNDGSVNERVARLEATVETIRAEIRESSMEIGAKVREALADQRVDVARLRADFAESKEGWTRWMIAILLSFVLGFAGLFASLWVRTQPNPQPPQASPAPIIITVPGAQQQPPPPAVAPQTQD
jgi:hypothetical protein